MRIEDRVSLILEEQGNVVIRTYKKGCPDLISIPADFADRVKAIEVKGPGDTLMPHQKATIQNLKESGIDASVRFVDYDGKETKVKVERRPTDPPKKFRPTKQQKYNIAKQYSALGFEGFHKGIERQDFPKYENRESWIHYERRAGWHHGWDKAFYQEKGYLHPNSYFIPGADTYAS